MSVHGIVGLALQPGGGPGRQGAAGAALLVPPTHHLHEGLIEAKVFDNQL